MKWDNPVIDWNCYAVKKTHKLSVEELLHAEAADIAVRLLQSAGNIRTITAFLEVLLKPISVQYCRGSPNEFCKDSRHYIEDLISWQKNKQRKLWKRYNQVNVLYYSSWC